MNKLQKAKEIISSCTSLNKYIRIMSLIIEHLEEQERSIKHFNLNPTQSTMAIAYRKMMEEPEIKNCDCTSIKPFKEEKKTESNPLFCMGCGQLVNQCDCWGDEEISLNSMSIVQLREIIRLNDDIPDEGYRMKRESKEDYAKKLKEAILNHFYPKEKSKFIRFQDWEVGKEYKTPQAEYNQNHYVIDEFGKVSSDNFKSFLSYNELIEFQWEEVK